jgi:hypothetical protein
MYLLGICTGLLFAILIVILNIKIAPIAERRLNQIQSSLKPKGKILEPESEALDDWIENLQKDI